MGELQIASYDSRYILPKGIYINTFVDIWKKIIEDNDLISEYKSSKKDYFDFINNCLLEQKIESEEVNNALDEELSYGKHKHIQMYNIQNEELSEEKLLNMVKEYYGIKTLKYNKLAYTYEWNDATSLDTIAYISILDKGDRGIVNKFRIIFVKKVFYKENEIKHYENSYFPIDIDFENNTMLVKYYDKGYLLADQRGEVIAQYYADRITTLLNIKYTTSKQTMYQRALYNICDHILNSVICEKSKLVVGDLDAIVKDVTNYIEDKIEEAFDIKKLHEKYKKNVFDTRQQVYKIIENIAISKVIIESKSDEYSSVNGLISYITYKERGLVRTVIRNPKRDENLLDSQSYLSLRIILEESKYIEVLKMIWKSNNKNLSIKYDASKWQYMLIKFYKKYDKGDLVYALRQLYHFC